MVDGHEEQDRIDRLVAEGARDWRVPPAPPLDAMWGRIEAAHFDRRGAAGRPATRWWALAGAGMAAALVLGVGVGRWSARGERQAVANRAAAPAPAMVVAMPPDESGPFALATTDYLDETAALLAALPAESPDAQGRRLAGQAAELLTTTRLLLDSPAARDDAELRDLLDDLELVLAQVARLREPRARRADMELINEAIRQRDMLPRLRTAAAERSASE